ncbi:MULTISPECIES: ribulose-phosphate 3-epimerase [Globicatella]|uniref:ribulose-phosphate 3-epimerase n=1 Tax=Globicatella TaxID=13075 RepID=UPI0008D3942C|nr:MULTISPECIES: ribulose-phosphate 3-epimerase [Globicatella]MDK7631322.1 ribulose-phosphate 3-epimerase [Globicatella sanguinis]OFK58232.1 ribulose-phosphate 3-epimerase [Globicatella sp. HMSC072A10]WIK65823.1 ribulose-phosphate 3-epimerase [Globicatella sanguinis]WKT55228.1 ribulose-phosphate 3-epimerase [Globicatella sanguinis]
MSIAPSLLNASILEIKDLFNILEEKNIDYLHIDVMDGCFVPDMAFGPSFIKDIRPFTDVVFDVHLMIETPEKIVKKFVEAGADIVTFHIEATNHAMRVIQMVKEAGAKVGITFNPATPVSFIEPILSVVDQVLVMTINPGTENKHFILETVSKIEQLDLLRKKNNYRYVIEVDGKIDNQTIKTCKKAGADIFVSGGYIFNGEDNPREQINKLYQSLEEVR